GKCSSAAATATCVSKVCDTVDDKCGFTDGHTCGADAECRSTDCGAVSKVCLPAGGCKVDGDCAATDYCDTPSSTCKAKLDNGEPIPTVTGHTPAVSGTCTSTAATVVCKSAVCDPVDNKCGLADGDGPCTSSTVCRSDVCSGGVCGAPDGGTDAGEDGGDTGVTDTGMASDSGGEDSSIEVDAASDAETDAETDGATTNADSGTLEGGGCSCTVPHSENESSSNKGLVMVGAALAIAGLRRRRR
ncbi:MAG: hypothetical protein ACXWUG_00255, partial [Polyangiales bacterium]